MGHLAYIPTGDAVEAAWERMQALARPLTQDPGLLTDRGHMEELARAERAWRDAFIAWDGKR